MAKQLFIRVDDNVLFDGEISEFQWNESATAVTAKGVLRRDAGRNGGGSRALLDALASAAKQRPAAAKPDTTTEADVEVVEPEIVAP